MKLKKFLKMVKTVCSEANCRPGACPMSWPHNGYNDCYISSDDCPEAWKVKKICKIAKKWSKSKCK